MSGQEPVGRRQGKGVWRSRRGTVARCILAGAILTGMGYESMAELKVGVGFAEADAKAQPIIREYNGRKVRLTALQKQSTGAVDAARAEALELEKKKLAEITEQLRAAIAGAAVAEQAYAQAVSALGDAPPQALVYFSSFSPLPTEQTRADQVLRDHGQKSALISVASQWGTLGGERIGVQNCLSLLALGGSGVTVKAAGVADAVSRMNASGKELAAQIKIPDLKLVLLFADPALSHSQGAKAHVQDFLNGLREGLGSDAPVVGGNASWGCTVRLNGQAMAKGAIGVALGGDLEVRAATVHGYVPAETDVAELKSLRVTKSSPTALFTLNDRPVVEVFQAYFPKECAPAAFAQRDFHAGHPVLVQEEGYALIRFSHGPCGDGGIEIAEKIDEGRAVALMRRDRERMLAETGAALERLLGSLKRPLRLIMVFPCEGRAMFEQGAFRQEEFARLRQGAGGRAPLCGFYSCGEYGTEFPLAKSPITRYYQYSIVMVAVGQ